MTTDKTAEEGIKGADVLVRSLAEQGVDTIFGVTGGASLEIFDALKRIGSKYGIRLVDTAKEDGAGFAAHGYARSTGKPGVVLTTSGPGATNALTPVTDASSDSIPLVFISGQVPSHMLGKGAFQEAPVTDMSRPVTKGSYLVGRVSDISDVVSGAYNLAMSGRPGPVHIDLPKDIQQSRLIHKGSKSVPQKNNDEYLHRKVGVVAKHLLSAKRPMLYVGGGILSANASEELRKLSENLNIPVGATLMGLGAFPGSDRNFLGMLGMHGPAYVNYAISGSPKDNHRDGADFVMTLGARFDDRVVGNPKAFANSAYKVHVDVDPRENGKNIKPDLFVLSDAKRFLAALNSRLGQERRKGYASWWKHIDFLKKSYPLSFGHWKDERGKEIPVQYVLEKLSKEAGPLNPIYSTGVGQHQMWAGQYLSLNTPRSFMTSAGLGTMGFGLPAAIGAQVANPDRLVIDIDGDRSFWMTGNELETIARFNLPVKVVIFDNGGHGMVQQWIKKQYEGRQIATEFTNIDFAEYAKILGIKGRRVSRLDQVDGALEEMIRSKGPHLLHVDARYENCLPMIPAGKSVKEMILQR